MRVPEGNDGRRSARYRVLPAYCSLASILTLACLNFTSAFVVSAHAQSVTINARAGEGLTLPVGQGRILRFDQPVESVFVGDPAIADLRVVSPGVIYVYAIKIGTTNLIALSPDQSLRGNMQLRVVADSRPIAEAQRTLQPTSPVNIRMFGNRVVTTGPTRGIKEAVETDAVAETFSPRDVPPLNTTTIPGAHQVNIRVRFAEVSRNE